jgi:SAM-dependent methyltransferase
VTVPLYDGFVDYDRFVKWERRLAHELPFLEQQLAASKARKVLDAACGTGRHAIALAQRGYQVTGADLSPGMIERARENAARAEVDVSFAVAGFGQLATRVGAGFDAVLCLGNSLPHVLTAETLLETIADFLALLRPGGVLLIQNRNLDAVVANQARWMPLQSYREDSQEWMFIRFYDFESDGTITFNVVTLRRDSSSDWTQHVEGTKLYPWRADQLVAACGIAGFEEVTTYGDMSGSPFDREKSGNLVVIARRPAE